MTYPKLPDGPSSAGAAAVRALPEGSFQTIRNASYTAKTAGAFSRVRVEGADEYLTIGLTEVDGIGKPLTGDSPDDSFTTSTVYISRYDSGLNIFISLLNIDDGEWVWVETVMTSSPGASVKTFTQHLVFGAVDDPANRITFTRAYDNNVYTVIPFYFFELGYPAYYGQVQVGTDLFKKVVLINSHLAGANSYGINYLSFTLDTAISNGMSSSVALPFPANRHYVAEGFAPIVTKTSISVVVFETFYYNPAVGATTVPSSPPPVWITRSTDGGASWSSPVNIVTAFPRLGAALALSSADMYELYASSLSFMSSFREVVVTGDDSFIMVIPYETVLPGFHTGNHYPDMIRVVGGTAYPVSFGDSSQHGIVTALAYMGAGKVVAAYTHLYNISGTEDGSFVDFWSSVDGGITWVQHASPTGFNNNLSHDFVNSNYLLCDEPATDTDNGSLLITAWDQTEGSYFVYSSTDLGASWTRGGRITQAIPPGDFYATYGTAGDQFGKLEVMKSAASLRDLDPALPTRYDLR